MSLSSRLFFSLLELKVWNIFLHQSKLYQLIYEEKQ